MTRPVARNGFGLTVADAEPNLRVIEAGMSLFARRRSHLREWRRNRGCSTPVSGVQVYDARLAAAMLVHGIGCILTLNVTDFGRYAGITAVHPSGV